MENKVAIYARESTAKQDINTLISMCTSKAKELGFKEIIVYKDVESGYSNSRAEYLKMLEEIKDGNISNLILYESSRATRDEIEHHLFYRLLAQNEVKLYILNRGWVDPSDEDDLFFSSMLNLLDAREGRKTAKRVRDRMGELARQGKWTGGPAPLGYKLVEKELVVSPNEKEIVQEIFRLFLNGISREEISNKFGFERKKVARILKNEIYVGKVKYRQQQIVNKEIVTNKDYETFEGIHEPIIDISTFNAVQNRLKKVKRVRRSGDDYIFKGLLTCYCGQKMYPRKLRGKVFYTCISKSNGTNCGSKGQYQDELIESIIESIKESLELFSVCDQTSNQEELESRKKLYKRELGKIEKQEETLLRKYLEGVVEEKIYNKFVEELQSKKSFYKEELKKLDKLIANQSITDDSIELLREYISMIEVTKDIEKLSLLFRVVINEIVFVNDFRCKAMLNI